MKRTTYLLLVLSLLSIALFYSCQKEEKPVILPAFSTQLNNFFKSHAAPIQHYTVTAESGQYIVGQKGSGFYIFPNAFKNASGTIVTGNIDIEIREIYSKKDMILSGATTVSNNDLLVSGGEFYINATQNGQQLTLIPGKIYLQTVASGNTHPMQLFTSNGTAGINENNPGFNTLNWVLDSSAVATNDTFYYSNIPTLGWINFDHFYYSTEPKDSLRAILSDNFNCYNTMMFLSFDGLNLAMSMYTNDWNVGTVFVAHYIPNGMNLRVVTISNINGQFYYSENPLVSGPGAVVNPLPTTITEADMLTALNNLP